MSTARDANTASGIEVLLIIAVTPLRSENSDRKEGRLTQ